MQDEPTPAKRCNICGETKPLIAFWADHRRPDGRQTRCADCANRRRAETKLNGVPPRPPMYVIEDRGHVTPCWTWLWGKTSKGYGGIRRDGRNLSAHRYVYELHKGPIPVGLDLDHLCRHRDCVNPAHLEPVLNAENVRRGRRAKLTWPEADVIRDSPLPYRVLAERYGITEKQIWKIKSKQSWNRERQWHRPAA